MDLAATSPYFSIVVTVKDGNAHLLCFTLDSIFNQIFDSYEVIVIDAQTMGQPVNVLDAYRGKIKQILKANNSNLSAMWNQGIERVQGEFVHFLQPGEFYISCHALEFIKEFIDQNPSMDLVYTGYIMRHSLSPQQQLFKRIDLKALKQAKIPQGLQAYWFKRDALKAIGKFKTRYEIQGGYDLICRLYQNSGFKKILMQRVLTDYEYRLPKPKWIIKQLSETFLILISQFGLGMSVLNWMGQNNLRFFRWWCRSIKGAFWKGSTY